MSILRMVITGILLFTVFLILYLIFLLSPASFSSEKIRIVVPLEGKQEEIITELKEKKLIRSVKMLNLIAGIFKFPGNIEPGAYMLRRNMNLIQITDTLMNHPYQKWVILVPGLRDEQIAERLAKKFSWDGVKTKEFLEAAEEGMMFPDTYLLNVDYTGKEFAQRLKNNFNEKFDAKMQEDLLAQNVKVTTMLKIASLIERESGSDDDKALIAGIIWNRLEKNMKLQIDATIQYALGTPSDWWPHVKPQDTKLDSPYNTYIIKGLPPDPIANPSLASIKAAVYPRQTDCLYYLHSLDKRIHCAVTYKEHQENIEKYLR